MKTSNKKWAVASRQVLLEEGSQGFKVEPAVIWGEGATISQVELIEGDDYLQKTSSIAEQVQFYDLGKYLVSPAFINAHTHLALVALRSLDLSEAIAGNMVEQFFFAFEKKMTPEDVRAFTLLGAYESLLNGVGLVWEHYYHSSALVEAFQETGLAAVVAPTLQDLRGPGVPLLEEALEHTQIISVDTSLADKGIYAALGPHATDTVSGSLWGEILALSEKHQLPIHAHLSQSIEEYRRSLEKNACTPTEWLQGMGVLSEAASGVWAHAIYCSQSDLELLKAGSNQLVFCPYSQLIFGFPARADLWMQQGIPFAVATDSAASNDSMHLQKELRYLEGMKHGGASYDPGYRDFLSGGGLEKAEAAWRARNQSAVADVAVDSWLHHVWRIPGRMHPRFTAGTIQRGALANFCFWDLQHPSLWPAHEPARALALSDSSAALQGMMVSGKMIGEVGNYAESLLDNSDYRSMAKEASKRVKKLL